MKFGFLLTDCNGNNYRTIATSLTDAVKKTTSQHDLKENDLIQIERSDPIDSMGF